MRICSLLPGATETLYLLGMGEQVVGISDDCDRPPEVREKAILSKSVLSGKHYSSAQVHSIVEKRRHRGMSIFEIEEESLRRLRPDLIVTQELCEVCAVPYSQVLKAAKVLEQGPKIISLEPRNLNDVLENIGLLGGLTGAESKAEEIVGQLKERLEAVRSKSRDVGARPRVLCIEWVTPLMAAGHWVPEMIELAGGFDGLVKAGEWTRTLDWSTVAEYKPDVIVVSPCSYTLERSSDEVQRLRTYSGWESLPAVKHGRVYAVNARWYFSRSGPGLVTGTEIMAEIIHPEIFGGLAPPDSYRAVE